MSQLRGGSMYLRFSFLFFASVAICSQADSFGQTLYSYFDDDGVRVFTNLPPVRPMQDLKITDAISFSQPLFDSSSRPGSRYDSIIEKYAAIYHLDPSLVRSVIAAESGFNSKAVSPKGAGGLMQLMPATATRLGVGNVFDPEENIRGGTRHLRSLLNAFDNNLTLSLAAYNAGENLVQRLGRVPEIRETRNYVSSVTRHYGKSDISAQPLETARVPSTFRYVDEAGVLHLTNIPPVER